jgi:hypothetical protein
MMGQHNVSAFALRCHQGFLYAKPH